MEEQKQNTDQAIAEPASGKKPRPLFKKIIWGIVVLILFVAAIQIAVADKYSAQVIVIAGEKKVGVNPTTEKLDFGDLSADTTATRFITLNADGMDTYILVWKFGGIAELIKLNKNNFIISQGQTEKLEFSLYMPPSAPIDKKYSGYVWIFKLPKIW